MIKLKEVLDSRNFLVTILTIALGFITANEIQVQLTPEQIADGVIGKDLLGIASFVLLNFFNVLTKIGAKFFDKTWSWDWIKSKNFLTQVLTILTIVLGVFFDATVTGIVVTIVINIINLIVHVSSPAKGEG